MCSALVSANGLKNEVFSCVARLYYPASRGPSIFLDKSGEDV